MEKYLNEALIGNKNILATYTQKGELQRIYYPTKDNNQFINFYHVGVKVNDSNLIYLHDDVNNEYKQYYDVNTNILNTEITNNYFKLKIVQTDFVPIKENIIAKKYTFINENNMDLDVNLFVHSELVSDKVNNFVSCRVVDNGMVQYSHDYMLATIAQSEKICMHQINDSKNTIKSANIQDKDYIGMSNDSSIAYKIGNLKPKEKKEIEICIVVQEQPNSMSDFEKEIERIRRIDIKTELSKTKSYWRKYVKTHDGLNFKEVGNSYEEILQNIYYRSILLFPLLVNHDTGGIIASPEIDEDFTKCGRYAYCWPRDAAFITRAMDILKMEKETEKFYKVFCKKTQSKNGMWEQRFYTDGRLAPSWGYQIDETASVIYGVYTHYQKTNSFKFLKDTLPMCEKALDFLKRYVKDILSEANRYQKSYDLWEECESVHLYSLSSIYSAFNCMLDIYKVLGKNVSDFENNRLKDEKIEKNKSEIEKLRKELKLFIQDKMYDSDKKCYVRNPDDKMLDISILGSVIPFNVFTPKEKKIENTVERINMSLRTYTGGYMRYEGDTYAGGNPWVIANCWLTLYYLERGENRKAKETFDFVIKTAGVHSLLGEQIDNNTLKPNWVIGLGWSHAMFIIVLEKMLKG